MFVSNLFIKKPNILSIILILIILLPFFISQLLQSNEILSSNTTLNLVVNAKTFQEMIINLRKDNFFLLIFSFFINLSLLIFIPILGVTIFEILLCNKDFKKSITSSSIFRILKSKGPFLADFLYFLFRIIFNKFPFIVVFLTLGLSAFNDSFSIQINNFFKDLIPDSSNIFNSTFLSMILILFKDFLTYAVHRIHHKIQFLWDQHEFHHSATEMTIFNKFRETPIEKITKSLLFLPLNILTTLIVVGFVSKGYNLPILFYLLHLTMLNAFTFLGHSSLPIMYPKPISLFYMSPALHLIHHSDKEEHYDSNFSEGFVFWDKLFGTYKSEKHLEEIIGYGVKNTEYNKNSALYSFTLLPILKLLKTFKRKTISV